MSLIVHFIERNWLYPVLSRLLGIIGSVGTAVTAGATAREFGSSGTVSKRSGNADRSQRQTRRTQYTRKRQHLYQLRWLPIISRIHLRICCIIYKLLNSPNQPSYLITLLSPSANPNSRKPVPLLCPRAVNNSSWSTKSFFFSGPRIYNSLPKAITSSTSYRSFSRSLRNYLFDISYDHSTFTLTPFSSL